VHGGDELAMLIDDPQAGAAEFNGDGLASVATVNYRIRYSSGVGDQDIYLTSEVATWLENLQATDAKSAGLADDAIYALKRSGPAPGRPLAGTIAASKIKNLKELRPGSSGTSEIHILSVSGPWRSAILLAAPTSPEMEPVVCRGDPACRTAL
jgi:hypothetical protein